MSLDELTEGTMSITWSESVAASRNVAGTALIGKACDILETVGKAPGEVNHAMLAEKTGIPRATLYRIVAALTARGLIRVDPATQNYTLGFSFLELGQNAWSSGDLASIASVELRRLRDLTGETAYLAVQEGKHVLALGRFESPHPQRSNARLGALKPMHCTSQGKAILAHLTPAQLDTFLQEELTAYTHHTITDPRQLRANLAIIRARGFSTDDEEIVLGTRCVGAPILDADHRPIAAISVAAPIYRMTPERAEQLGFEIADIARRISAQLAPSLRPRQSTESNVSVLTANPSFFGACPIWEAGGQRLFWIDRLAPAAYGTGGAPFLSLETMAESLDAACLIENGALMSAGSRLAVIRDGHIARVLSIPSAERITALRVSSAGKVWAALLDESRDATRIGPLAPDGDVQAVFEIGGAVADLVFGDPDTLFATVPSRSTIYLLELSKARKRRFSDVPKVAGTPSALAVDAEGGLWVAMSDGWSILKFDQDGNVVRTIAIPVPYPTGIAFGGTFMSRLFVTSKRIGLARDSLVAAPLSGHVLSVELGQAGRAEPIAEWIS
ncbi:IclR family transcriptional regulator domain-containing protein [Rhizobium binxianense]